MANIVIIGGHGKVALLLEPLLAERGDTATAIFRNPKQVDDVVAAGGAPVVADVQKSSVDELAELFKGADAVVWSAGAGGGSAGRTKAVDEDAAIRSMDAAKSAGVQRYIMVSYFGASKHHGFDPNDGFFAYAEAKAAADEYLRGTTLDWTILGPSALTLDAGTGRIDASATEPSQVARANVASVIAATLQDDSTIRRTIRFNDGDTPVAEAIATA